jgi:hypothetical protein
MKILPAMATSLKRATSGHIIAWDKTDDYYWLQPSRILPPRSVMGLSRLTAQALHESGMVERDLTRGVASLQRFSVFHYSLKLYRLLLFLFHEERGILLQAAL